MKLTAAEQQKTKNFRRQLETIAATRENPKAGIFGPDSEVWKISGELALFGGGMRALLLQIAHPKVAQGVADFSDFEKDPLGRGFRTFDAVFKIVFGTQKTAIDTAVQIFNVHQMVKGTVKDRVPGMKNPKYVATDPKLAFWVHATLMDSALFGYEHFVGPLSYPERTKFYEESKVFARFFGVPEKIIPPDYAAFQAYMREMIDGTELYVTPTARKISNALLFGGPFYFAPTQPINYLLAAGMMPPRLREDFEIKWNPPVRVGFNAITNLVRLYTKVVPTPLRQHPSAALASWRSRDTALGRAFANLAPAL